MPRKKTKKGYHGTSTATLDDILENGIRPRSVTGKSNWDKFKSRDDMVYLTTAYPLYFAFNAMASPEAEKCVVIEVDINKLEKKKIYPDEDFLAQVIAEVQGETLERVHPVIRMNLEKYRNAWRESLKNMGSVCHKGHIQVEAITRYAVVDVKHQAQLVHSCLDPTITYMNYQIMGSYYEGIVAWIMGDIAELPHVERARNDLKAGKFMERKDPKNAIKGFVKNCEERIEAWSKWPRTGIEVVDMSKLAVSKS